MAEADAILCSHVPVPIAAAGGVKSIPTLSPIDATVVGIAPAQSGAGYWPAQSNGGSFLFGDAPNLGNLASLPLNAPVVNEGD
jgi:hypothetical protein